MKPLKTFITVLAIMSLLGSCREEEKIPSEILPEAKMVKIMADIQLAEAALTLKNQQDTAGSAARYYAHIFKTHQVSADGFEKSFQWYERRPVLMNKLYGEVINELSKRQAEEAGNK